MTQYEDEIDLRPHIRAIIQHWWLIGLVALLFAIVAYFFSLRQPPQYTSTATILFNRSRPVLSLAKEFPNVEDSADYKSRLQAIGSIASSDAIALETLNALKESYGINNRGIGWIKSSIDITQVGDTFLISAKSTDPEVTASMATEYATQAVTMINQAYSGDQPLFVIQNQMDSAWEEYKAAQNALEEFQKQNRINLITQQIDEVEELFSNLTIDRAQRVSYYFSRKQSLEELIDQSETLKEQLNNGNSSTAGELGDALTVLHTRYEALKIRPVQDASLRFRNIQDANVGDRSDLIDQPPSTITILENIYDDSSAIDIQLSDIESLRDTKSNYVADINTIIKIANEEKIQIEALLESLANEILETQDNKLINQSAQRISELESQLESESAYLQEITSQRDLAWQAYQALSQKVIEIKNASDTSNAVTLASPAVVPQRPSPSGTTQNLLIAVILGIMVGVLLVIATVWWRSGRSQSTKTSPRESDDIGDK